MLLRSTSGVLGTIEVGNTFPGDGTDMEIKLAGRDALLLQRDDTLRLETARGSETTSVDVKEPPARTALRDALEHWERGDAAPIGVEDCARAVRLIDEAYALAAPL